MPFSGVCVCFDLVFCEKENEARNQGSSCHLSLKAFKMQSGQGLLVEFKLNSKQINFNL